MGRPRSARLRDGQVVTYLASDELAQLDAVAEDRDVSRSHVVRHLVRQGLKGLTASAAPPAEVEATADA